ncbi:uncharacterized protein LOC135809342 [Sycon ciliatum]|uniref:uncharacterized protein LOC135809342 n=1 Tax=Sycon ciliatum TaxID=27933 RepID=UPI0020AEBC78|eukprot:scpid37233/ scgid15750/ Serine carboxypeptidase-like 20
MGRSRVSGSLLFALLVGCVSLKQATAVVEADEVKSFPGYGAPPTKHYSGYITIKESTHRRLHYLYVESVHPKTDPLVVWLQGGPGCSSLMGYFTENGPLYVHPDGKTLYQNPNSWNLVANMLYIEAPAGVGFSSSDSKMDYATNDSRTADDNLKFLLGFFEAYPELRSRDFYISGESYAGIYIPTLSYDILKHNEQASAQEKINLQGILVGNGCIGAKVGVCGPEHALGYAVPFLYAHGLISMKAWNVIREKCGASKIINTTACGQAVQSAMATTGPVNSLDIYGNCSDATRRSAEPRFWVGSRERLGAEVHECIGGLNVEAYLRTPEVMDALHVTEPKFAGPWSMCSPFIEMMYTRSVASLLDTVYPALISHYRVLIFNGDADAVVPYTDNEQWTSGMGYKEVAPFQAWLVDGQVAGYITRYENDFSFATVKGAGHMVPQFKPKAALALLTNFLSNK